MIDARGRSCPEPVVMLKKALASQEKEYTIMVDNAVSCENVTRFAQHSGYTVETTEQNNEYTLKLIKK